MDTIRAHDFQLVSCQATLFTPEEEVSALKLLTGLLPQWAHRFDNEPQNLPAESGIPREMPRLILENKLHSWRCQIASARIDLFWKKITTPVNDITLVEFFHEASIYLNAYRRFLGARVGRMAAVLTRYAEHPTPGPFIARHFSNERWLHDPFGPLESCEFHTHRHLRLAEQLQVNLWVRSKTGTFAEGAEKRPIVLLEQDINTLHEEIETHNFSEEDIKRFFSLSIPKFEEMLQLYYPEEEKR